MYKQGLCVFVLQLHSDMDRGENTVKYTLSGEGVGSIFTIDQLTGDIHALVGLDRSDDIHCPDKSTFNRCRSINLVQKE